MAPATLIDKRIQWPALVVFVSDDRYAAGDKGAFKKMRWMTPIKDYKEINGHHLVHAAEAVYDFPEGKTACGIFTLTDIAYNIMDFQ